MKSIINNFRALFSKKKTEKSPGSNSENPYLNARRSWNSHASGLMSSARLWQFIGLSSMLGCLAAVSGLIIIGGQSKFVPLVFQQDSSGNIISVTKADRVPEAKIDDYRTAAVHFIENIRLVTADVELQRKAIFQTYAYLSANDPSTTKANNYLNGSKELSPFYRAGSEIVSIEIRSALQETKESWQVDWVETVRNRDGSLKGQPQSMRAIITLYQNEELTDASNVQALRNPHFIFVRDFNWSKQL